ncbi:hypothetical protein Kalk_10205 [Ketobacter alkanivorans]|uniref:Uncharacterized protein n=1 Tax=Ketobacter alkanivorans TaxID=1917421 RepID=A0A2K9LKK6_9GAMM|nr:hypothetical protein Kalk_10205 [Ketobacter alkanivorans]
MRLQIVQCSAHKVIRKQQVIVIVRHRHDARAERNCIAGKFAREAFAVIAFMMAAHDGGRFTQRVK